MQKKSIGIKGTAAADYVDIKNTGLRPSWDEFWKVDHMQVVEGEVTGGKEGMYEKTATVSTISSFKSEEGGYRHVKFITGSEWHGEWDRLGMNGMGVYKMPHGVMYEGTMNAGVFEGIGTLRYPNGGLLEGFWREGKLKYCQYDYKDGLKRDTLIDWLYCRYPDRRFYSELQHSLKPASHEQITNSSLARDIPAKQFDVGDGFYNPVTKCVTDPVSGEVLRIPSTVEEQWILANSRAAELDTVGYRPDLYQNLFREKEELDLDEKREETKESNDIREILNLIQQDEDLESRTDSSLSYPQNRSSSLQSKLDHCNLGELKRLSSIWSRSMVSDFESVMKKIFKDKSPNKPKLFSTLRLHRSSFLEDYEDFHDDDDMSIARLLQDIAITYNRGSRVAQDMSGRSPASTLLEAQTDPQPAHGGPSIPDPSSNMTSTYTLPMSKVELVRETEQFESRNGEIISKESSHDKSLLRLEINYSDYDNDKP